jgi:GT2 family glycosyltransferase
MNDKQAQPFLSVIVVTWNGRRYVMECLESLRRVPRALTIEIIVVDNASTDGTPDAIEEEFQDIILVRSETNVGFAKANNLGIQLSTGRHLCLVNSDVVIPPGCLERLVDYMERNPSVGVLGPKMLSPIGDVGYSVMRLPTVWNSLCCAVGLHTLLPASKWFAGFQMNGYPYDSVDDVEVLTGWFWMISRPALGTVGGLDERFFMYGEDIDWCHRFRDAGWRVVFYPFAEALHYGAASSGKTPIRFYIEMHRANLQYFRKHHGRLGWLGYLMVMWIHHSLRIAANGLASVIRPSSRADAVFKVKRSALCLAGLAGFSGREPE